MGIKKYANPKFRKAKLGFNKKSSVGEREK
jgi:hypothetical protein